MGFKNAPDINEYKRGMRINYGGEKNGEWWTVAWVAEDGKARAYNSNKSPGAFPLDSMPDVTLDLASIWEGQERWGHGGGKAVVRMADSEFVIYHRSSSERIPATDCPRLCRRAEFVSIFPYLSDPTAEKWEIRTTDTTWYAVFKNGQQVGGSWLFRVNAEDFIKHQQR